MAVKEFWGGFDTRLFVLGKTKRVLLPYLIVGVFLCLLQERHGTDALRSKSPLVLGRDIRVLHDRQGIWQRPLDEGKATKNVDDGNCLLHGLHFLSPVRHSYLVRDSTCKISAILYDGYANG